MELGIGISSLHQTESLADLAEAEELVQAIRVSLRLHKRPSILLISMKIWYVCSVPELRVVCPY
jgi:hypothetical protein